MNAGRQISSSTAGSGSESLSLESIVLNEHHGAPLPENEQERMKFLRNLNVLDTVGEDAFDVITRLLTDIFKVPIALVSLVDSSRQWFKSCVGLSVRETPRELSFCAHLLLPESPSMLLIPDATLDPRFKNSPLVTGDPFIRLYCGAPILLGGVRLGSLCIIDREPRDSIGQKDAMLLANFADIVAGLIDKERKQATQYEMLDHPSFLIEVTKEKWPILYSNELGKNLIDEIAADSPRFLDMFKLDEVPSGIMLNETRAQEGVFSRDRACLCTFHPASRHGFGAAFGKDLNSQILFPYAEPKPGSPEPKVSVPEAADSAASAPQPSGKEYNFVVVKWAKDESELSASSRPTSKSSLRLLNSTPAMSVIQTVEDFESALTKEMSIVMLTSEFCAACVHFTEFYSCVSRVTRGVHFNVVSVDDFPSLARRCTTGAVFLPSVFFYKSGKNVDQLQGSHCAQFRKKLASLLMLRQQSSASSADLDSIGEKSDSSPSTEECLNGMCQWTNQQDVDKDNNSSMLADLTLRLEAERAYSRSLEASLSGSMAAQLMELRKDHEASLARVALLKRDLMTRRRQRAVGGASRGAGISINEEGEFSEDDSEIPDSSKYPQERPNYHFHGTVAKFLKPVLAKSRVLIYGGARADFLEGGMKQMGIDVSRQLRTARSEAIPTQGRRGRPIAIVDVIDVRSPQATWEWFEKVSDALSVGGILATISVDFDLLEVLGMLGETYGWAITCTEGSKRDYGIIVLEKGPDSDNLIQSWAVESFVEQVEEGT